MYGLQSALLVILATMQGMKFSRYEIKDELGRGGMATVYRAYDPMFDRVVALKILRRELLDESQLVERFERETRIIARLEHAAIVPVYDAGRDNDQLFYVMRYMAGGTLSERIKSGTLSLNEIAHIIQRIASALDYAHDKGVIHRDLKPGNILFDEYGNASISDFGIAKFAHASTELTNSGIIGTPTYMSPEQARGEEVDGRSDIYSLGVILFEMLSGKTPFEASGPLAMAMKHALDPAPHIRDINPNLSVSMDAVLDKVLVKDREERYQSGVEFANAFIATLPEPLTPDANLITPLPPRAPKHDAPTKLPRVTKPRTNARMWMIGGLIVLTLLAFAIWQLSRSPAMPASTPTLEPATVTATLASPTALPIETAIPTETITPTLPVEGVYPGGADKIALTANRDIYLMDIDGANVRQLTNTNLPKFDLQWLPGGNELLYGEGKCVYKINVNTPQAKPEEIVCFTAEKFEGFRVSPDGKYTAISIERRLIIFPFDLKLLPTAKTAFDLQAASEACLDYTAVAVKSAQWSADGKNLAILYQGAVGDQLRLGDTIRVFKVDTENCQDLDPLITAEIPNRQFTPEDYVKSPVLPAYFWDGHQQILFNTLVRNAGYGTLYLYNMSTTQEREINLANGTCCYRDSVISPDGTHILLFFQDVKQGSDSETQMYYIPIDQFGSGTTFTPIKLPLHFFPNPRENLEVALHPVP